MIVITKEKNMKILDALGAAMPDTSFSHTYTDFDEIVKPGLVLNENTLTYDKASGLKIKRHTNKILILCKDKDLNSEKINEIRDAYGNYFHIYVEGIDKILDYIKDDDIDSFSFKENVYSLFKNYYDMDFLYIAI